MNFMDAVGRNEDINNVKFDPDSFRSKLIDDILKNSEDLNCQLCLRSDKKIKSTCQVCQKVSHQECLSYFYSRKTINNWNKQLLKNNYICVICWIMKKEMVFDI